MKTRNIHWPVTVMLLAATTNACDGNADPDASLDAADMAEEDRADPDESHVADYQEFEPEEASDAARAVAAVSTRVIYPEGVEIAASVEADAEELRLRFANALLEARDPEFYAARSSKDEVIEIRFKGQGRVATEGPRAEDRIVAEEDGPPRFSEGSRRLVGFNGATRNEFEVRIPEELAALVGDDGRERGISRGWPGGDELQPRGIVGPNDTRVLRGMPNTAQTGTRQRRIVGFVTAGASADAASRCTGTLVGRHHVLSAAHCIYRHAGAGEPSGSWIEPGLRVGRNGTDWVDGANTSTGSRWFWIEAEYQIAADQGGSPRAWDFGMIITPTRHIGSATGWFGWGWSNTSQDDMQNRGYPNPPPAGGLVGHMYGDTNDCNTGDFSAADDSFGYSLYGYHSCDTTGGHSGSPLYRQNADGDWVVRGVHKGASNPNTTTALDENLWNSFALVTRDRSDMILYFRATFP